MKKILIVVSIFCFQSCKVKQVETFSPPQIVESQPSWDGYEQNSGLIDYIEGKGFLISPNAASRYKYLTKKFGNQTEPSMKEGEGLIQSGENFLLSPESMVIFMELSDLNKSK